MKVNQSHALIVLIAVVGFITNGCNNGAVHRSIRDTLPATAPDSYPKVLAVYVPWFGTKDHISVGYSTQDPAVLKAQIEKAKGMGIYGFAINWYGERRPFEDRSSVLLQQVASQNGFKVCVMYDEPQEDTGQSTEEVLQDFDSIYKSFIGPNAPGHDSYIYYNGRPLIFVFPKRGHTDWNQVRSMVDKWPQKPLMIYKDEPPEPYLKAFDGIYAWVHPGEKWMEDGSDWGESYLDRFYQRMKNKHPDKLAMGGIWPGFDDTRASWSLNRHMDQRCGKTFQETLNVYHRHYDRSRPLPFLVLATWNDYEEGTAVERGLAQCNKDETETRSGGGAK